MRKDLILNKFPTHVAQTNNKYAKNKYWKVNSQGIYNGSVQRFTRANIVSNMHKYIMTQLSGSDIDEIKNPVQLKLDIYIPVNYATVRRNANTGIISWNKPKKGYQATNDEDNISWIWIKCIKDCLTELGVWKDDNLMLCRGTNSLVHFIDDLEDRKIVINFIDIKE